MVKEWRASQEIMANDAYNTQKTLRLADLDDEKAALAHKAAMDQMNAGQRLEAEKRLAEQRYVIERETIEKQLGLSANKEDEQARLNNQLLLLDREYATKKKELAQESERELKAIKDNEISEYKAAMNQFYAPMASGYKDALRGMFEGSMTFSDGYKRMLQGLGQALDQFCVEALSSWFDTESKKFVATVMGAEKRVAVEQGAAGAVEAAKTAEGVTHATVETEKTVATGAETGARASMSWSEAISSVAAKAWEGLKYVAAELKKTMTTVANTVKRVAQATWAATREVAITAWKVAQEVALESWAALKKLAIKAGEALKSIAIKAYDAAAGAYQALVSIHYVGPYIAPAAAAVTLAAVLALGAKVASAEGGWGQVPSDQLAMVHKQEMVLPAKYAEPLRQMLQSGGIQAMASMVSQLQNAIGSYHVPFDRMTAESPVTQNIQRRRSSAVNPLEDGGVGTLAAPNPQPGGGEEHIHFHVSAIDAKGVEGFLRTNRAALVKTIKGAHRDNAF